MNTIFRLYGLNKLEPGLYKRWVFAGNSLAIVRTAPALRELRCTLDKVVNPVLANRLPTPLSQQFYQPYLAQEPLLAVLYVEMHQVYCLKPPPLLALSGALNSACICVRRVFQRVGLGSSFEGCCRL
jgi:hypothetical protein